MKRQRKLLTMFVVLLVTCIAAYAAISYEEHKEQIKTTGEIFIDFESESFTSLSWEYDNQEFSFTKDEKWVYDFDENFPVDEEKLLRCVQLFDELGSSFVIENPEDLSVYGLDDPICTIQWNANETDYKMTVGNYSNMDEERYVSIGDGHVYLITKDPVDYFDKELDDFLKHDELPSLKTVNKITLTGDVEGIITNDENNEMKYREEDNYILNIDNQYYCVDSEKAELYIREIGYLSLSNYVTYDATDEDLEKYGLNDPLLKIEVIYDEEETLVVSIGSDSNDKKVFRLNDSQMIYQLSDSDYEDLCGIQYNDLRHDEVMIPDFEDVVQIDISLEDSSYTFVKDGSKTTYLGKEIELDDFQNALEILSANEFTDEVTDTKEEVKITLTLDHDVFESFHIQLIRYDGQECIAVVNGKPVSKVERSLVVELIEAIQDIVLS